MKTLIRNLKFVALAAMVFCAFGAQAEKAAKAVYYSDTKTLSFYYDETDYSSQGTQYLFEGSAIESGGEMPWHADSVVGDMTNVMFNSSFAGYAPTGTANWFYDCAVLKGIKGIANLNTSSVTDMSFMFCRCLVLAELNLGKFNTANVKNMGSMFDSCYALKTIYASESFTTEAVTESDYMFNDCTSLSGGNGTSYDSSHTDAEYARIDKMGYPGYFTEAPLEPKASVTTNGVTTLYSTLTNAWKDATTLVKNVDVLVTLLEDATVDSTLVRISGGKILTLDLNDKVLAYAGADDVELIRQAGGTAMHVVDTAPTRTPRYFTCDAETGLWTLTNEVTDRVVSGGLITGGRASALNVSYGGASISNVNFVGNCNAGNGGAVVVSKVSLTVAESAFLGNVSAQNGGAISAGNHCEMSDCRVEANVATNCGGGVYMGLSGLLVRTSVVGNMAATGGVYLAYNPSSCFPAGVKILMADGAEKNVEDIVKGDVVATFDHIGGTNSSAAVFYVYSGTGSSDAFALTFASGATLEIVDRHDLLSETTRKYVTVSSGNARTFIGSRFYNYATGGWDELVGVKPAKGGGAHYSIYVAGHANCVANGLITVPDDKDCFINVYELDENLKVDAAQLAADIATYGLAKPADYPNIPPEDFADGNIRFARIAIGKGLVTQEELLFWNEYDYGPVVEKKQDSSVPVLMMSAEPMPLTAGSFMVAAEPSVPYLSVGEGTVVTGNVTTAGEDSNVHLLFNGGNNPVIHILPDTVKLDVGVTLSTGAGVFGFENDVNHATCFTPDDPKYTVVYNAEHQLELKIVVPIIAEPTVVEHTTVKVYTNGFLSAETAPKSGKWNAWSNDTAYVVYKAESGYCFEDGTTVQTNELDTSANPAGNAGGVAPVAPAQPSIRLGRVSQRYPWNGMVDVGIRAKNWPARGYAAKLVVNVGEASVTNRLGFGTATGAFMGEVAVDLNEIAPNSRGEANFEIITGLEPVVEAIALPLIVVKLKYR